MEKERFQVQELENYNSQKGQRKQWRKKVNHGHSSDSLKSKGFPFQECVAVFRHETHNPSFSIAILKIAYVFENRHALNCISFCQSPIQLNSSPIICLPSWLDVNWHLHGPKRWRCPRLCHVSRLSLLTRFTFALPSSLVTLSVITPFKRKHNPALLSSINLTNVYKTYVCWFYF